LLGLAIPVWVDNMDNAAWAALGCWPNMAIIISTGGVCVANQGWFRPAEFEPVIESVSSA